MGKKTNLKTYQGTDARAIAILVCSVVAMMYIFKLIYDWCCLA